MKKLTFTFLITLFTLTSNVVWSADYNKGVTAYNIGDFTTALLEFKPLAEQGDDDAQFWLGLMYDKGNGVPQNYKTAIKWYTYSANQGDANAQNNLGQMYRLGEGTPVNYQTAVKWYRLAAEQGSDRSQFNLGISYLRGEGVIKDNVYAHMWANISASNGHEDAKRLRDFAEESMTSADISKAQNLARECLAKNYKGC